MDTYRKYIKHNMMLFVAHILIYAKGIILLPILIKNVGVSLYGSYVLLMTGIGFISAVSSLGVGFKYSRFMPSAESIVEKRKLFYPQFVFRLTTALLISVILMVFSGLIKASLFKNESVFAMYYVAFILISFVFYNVTADYFRYTHRMGYFTIITTSQPYIMILLLVLFVYIIKRINLNTLLTINLYTLLIITPPFLIKVFKEIGTSLPRFHIKTIIEDVCLGFPLVLSYIVDFILSGSDRFVIALFISTTAVGYYSSAYALGSLIVLFPRVFGVVLPPLLAKANDQNKFDEVKTLINYSLKIFLIISIPFVFGCYFLSKPLLRLLANEEVANAAYLATPILAIGILFYGLNLILYNILYIQMKTKLMFWINVFPAVLNIILNLIFIYYFRNIVIATITTLISYLLSFVILNVKVKKYLVVKYDILTILKCLLASCVMGAGLYSINVLFKTRDSAAVILVLGGTAIYITMLFMLRTFSVKEIKYFLNHFKGSNVSYT